MWPMLLDMSRDECKRILRRLELEAYASIITAFRAQGALTKEKKTLLKDVAFELNISTERHRAEVRRAVNDEKLATIAEHMAGPDTGTEWAIVGRRLVPLMPRLVPQTAFTVIANNVANITAAGNARLPVPAATAKLPGSGPESSAWEPSLAEGSRVANCPAPPHSSQPGAEQSCEASNSPNDCTSTVSEVHIKRELEDEDEENSNKGGSKRMRTLSSSDTDSTYSTMITSLSQARPVSTISSTLSSSKLLGERIVPTSTSQSVVVTSSSATYTASRMVTVSAPPVPVKITLTSTPTWSTSTTSTTSSGSTQKVIIVSSSGSCGSPSILHRSLSVPMVKTVSSTQSSSSASSSVSSSGSTSISSALSRGPTSYIINSNGGQVSSQSGTVVTISTGSSNESSGGPSNRNNLDGVLASASSGAVSILGSSSSGSGNSASSSNMIHKIRPKPQSVSIGGISRPRTGPIVIPVTPNTHHPLHQTLTCGGTSTTVQQQKPKSLLGVHTVKQEVTGCTVSALGKSQGGMKILPISGMAGGSGSSMAKILPKPAKGSNLYVVNANSSTTTVASQMSVVSRVVPTSVLSSTSNLNLSTSSVSVLGTRTVTTGSGNRINLNATAVARSVNTPSVLPVSSSGSSAQHAASMGPGGTGVLMHQTGRTVPATAPSSNTSMSAISSSSAGSLSSSLSTVSSIAAGSGKSNVIVVQKGPSGNTTFCRGVSLGTTTKELVGKVLKGKAINPSSMTAITVQRRPANVPSSTVCNNTASNKNGTNLNLSSSSSQGNVIVLDLSNEQIGSNSILNELLQGSGIYAEAAGVSSSGANINSSAEESNKIVDSSRLSPVPDSSEDAHINSIVESSTPSVLNVPQTRVVTYEEAVELFGASVGENGQIFLGKKAEDCKLSVLANKSTVLEVLEDVDQVPPVEAEVVKSDKELPGDKASNEKILFVPEIAKEECSSTSKLENKPMDIFSTAIASADINLDSIQYLDEDTEEEVGGYAVTIEPATFDAAEIQIEEENT